MDQVRSSNKRIYFDSEKKNSQCTSNRNTLVSLPATFGNLIGLSKLEIIDVNLGDLPKSFCELRSLKILDVSRNNLSWLPRTFREGRKQNNCFNEQQLKGGQNYLHFPPLIVRSLKNISFSSYYFCFYAFPYFSFKPRILQHIKKPVHSS